jgi:hypothetical protein
MKFQSHRPSQVSKKLHCQARLQAEHQVAYQIWAYQVGHHLQVADLQEHHLHHLHLLVDLQAEELVVRHHHHHQPDNTLILLN